MAQACQQPDLDESRNCRLHSGDKCECGMAMDALRGVSVCVCVSCSTF